MGVLAVYDQSRLSRGDSAYPLVKDLVFAGGRFLSASENIDTARPGWEVQVQVLQLHHGQTIRSLQSGVRRGQQGRVEADGSAGDFPYGYEAYYLDADWQERLTRRGPKPKKGLKVCDAEAERVKQVFAWFVGGRSIDWIAGELTRLGVPKGRRSSKPGWHPQQVRRMLGNPKYVGEWPWGMTTTVRDSNGNKKQVPVADGEGVVRERPGLRIVDQGVWERAQERLAELRETYGWKEGQKSRGPLPNPADLYPRSPLGTLLTCGHCNGRMHQHKSNKRRYYACANAKTGACGMKTQVPAERAEGELTAFVLDLLRGWPGWVRDVYRRTCDAVRAAAERVPAERERDVKRAAELGRLIGNLVDLSARGGSGSPAVVQRLLELEAEKAAADARLAESAGLDAAAVALPTQEWVAASLSAWAADAAGEAGPGLLLRHAVAGLRAEAVIAPGKRRGYARLRFSVNAWTALTAALGDTLPSAVRAFLSDPPVEGGAGPQFTIDLGGPTKLDEWAPRIAEWRAAGVKWKEIVERTGLDLNRVYRAYQRHTEATPEGPTDE